MRVVNHFRSICAALFALCGVVACSHDDTAALAGGSLSVGDLMSFTIDVDSSPTRASIASGAGATSDNITDFALRVTFEGMESEGATVTRYGEYWVSDPLYYWESGNTKIEAYHPAANESSDYPAQFTLPTDQSSDEGFLAADLLWAYGEIDIADSDTYLDDDIGYIVESKSASVNFSHLLMVCQVYITIDPEINDLSTNPIESVTLYDAYTQINLDIDDVEGDGAASPYFGSAASYGVVAESRGRVKFHSSSYVRDTGATGNGLALYEAIMIPGDYSADGGEPFIVVQTVDGRLFYKYVSFDCTVEDVIAGENVLYYEVNLSAESAAPLTDSYIEFRRDESDSANITEVESAGGDIASLLSKFRRCLAKRDLNDGMVICYLDSDDSRYYYDGVTAADLEGGEGDVMLYMPEFWYLYENVDDDHFRYHISESELEGGVYVEASLVGAYKGYVESEYYTYDQYNEDSETMDSVTTLLNRKLYSRSGVEPTVSLSQEEFIEAAQSRGAGHNIIDYDQHCAIALMLYAKYADRNVQSYIGHGTAASHTVKSGSTNTLGNNDSTSATTDYVNGLGIEGVFGGVSEWVSGVSIDSNYIWSITDQTSGEVRTVQAANSMGWITEVAAESGDHFDMVTTSASGGSGSTYYADYYHPQASPNSSASYALVRSYNTAEDNCGVAYSNTEYLTTENHTTVSSRLSFRGYIIETTDIDKFKRLELY